MYQELSFQDAEALGEMDDGVDITGMMGNFACFEMHCANMRRSLHYEYDESKRSSCFVPVQCAGAVLIRISLKCK